MKKILFLHSSSELYGSDKSLLNLIKNLDKKKFEIYVILPEDGPLKNELENLLEVNLYIKELAILRRKNLSIKGLIEYSKEFFKSIKYLKKIIKDNGIDIVYTNTSVIFPGGIAAKLLKKQSIWHIREIVKNKFERRIISIMVNRFSDIIIANSIATGNAITKNSKKLKVIYNAIETLQKVKKIKSDSIIKIGMAGRINRWKGQKLFVDTAQEICKRRKNVVFEIAGDAYKGEEYLVEELQKYIDDKKLTEKVKLLGRIEKMDEFYNGLDIFILPSIQPEPFGLVVIEAMSQEIPVIATKHGGPIEIIDNGINGYLVDYRNSYEMSKITNMLIDDEKLRKKIGVEAKKKKENMFNIDMYTENISEILENGR